MYITPEDKVIVHGLEDYIPSVDDFNSWMDNPLNGANADCTATVNGVTKTLKEWQDTPNIPVNRLGRTQDGVPIVPGDVYFYLSDEWGDDGEIAKEIECVGYIFREKGNINNPLLTSIHSGQTFSSMSKLKEYFS